MQARWSTWLRRTMLVGLLAVLLALLVPRVVGGATLTVRSGSMEPTYPVGSLVLVWPTPAERIQVGDVITFVDDQRRGNVTHRVVAVDVGPGGAPAFVTRGDANDAPDARAVQPEQLVGRVVGSAPAIGAAAATLRTPTGWLTFVVVPALVYIGLELAWIVRSLRGRADARDGILGSTTTIPDDAAMPPTGGASEEGVHP